MEINLSLSSDELDKDEVQQLTRQLCLTLRDDAGVDASLSKQDSAPGTRGAEWAQIVIAAIGSGGVAVALVNVLTEWVKRKKSLTIKAEDKDGRKIEITAENQNTAELTALLKSLTSDQESIEDK